MNRIEVIDLCSVSQCEHDAVSKGKESAKQESRDKSNHDETDKKVVDLMTVKDGSTTKRDIVESVMMCWEHAENLADEEPHDEPKKVTSKHVKRQKNKNMKKNMSGLH